MTASSGTPQLSQVRAGYLGTSGRPKADFQEQIAKNKSLPSSGGGAHRAPPEGPGVYPLGFRYTSSGFPCLALEQGAALVTTHPLGGW